MNISINKKTLLIVGACALAYWWWDRNYDPNEAQEHNLRADIWGGR